MNIIIDLEFTGLDNTFIADNEITQVKMMNVETGKKACKNFKVNKPVSIYDKVFGGITEYTGESKFSKDEFVTMLNEIGVYVNAVELCNGVHHFFGFFISQDSKMLSKYGIEIKISDMLDTMRRCDKYEKDLAVCSKMECVYYLLTGEIPDSNTHYDDRELDLLCRIFSKVKDITPNEFLKIMPHGHCAGMPLIQYVDGFRRAADGYRYNNRDLLADSLSDAIQQIESIYEVDFDEEDEF